MNRMLDNSRPLAPETEPDGGREEDDRDGPADWSDFFDGLSNIGAIRGPAGVAWQDASLLEGIPELDSPLAG